tara:strand:+ start:238 stop:1530 length:1293 start_codon:yes stop_codon:yes gene_type:complete
VFYSWWDLTLSWVPAVLCTTAFYGVIWIEKEIDKQNRIKRLALVILVLLLPLFYFKYNHFFYNEIIVPLTGSAFINLKVVLPLGISFITFTMISYVVDVYRGRFPIEKSLKDIFAYTLFFPQLIAGPILRPSELIPQLTRGSTKNLSSFGLGITIFTFGLVKKVFFSDSISSTVEQVYLNPFGLDPMTYWLAIWGFTVQIYCDFSGYTDMAIGSAIILGINLPLNFNKPYTAYNLQEFWQNWHITLSKWLRDYLYIPLGGAYCSKNRHFANILITMILGGLWHGANWTFIIWGVLHGVGIILVHLIKYSPFLSLIFSYIPRPLKWATTILFVMLTWVFFRSPDLSTAWIIISGAFAFPTSVGSDFLYANIFPLLIILIFAITHRFDSIVNIRLLYHKSNKIILGVFILAIWIISIAVSHGSSSQFIYFDF